MKSKLFANTTVILFILLFIYTSCEKLFHLQEFKSQLAQSPILSHVDWFVSLAVPTSELIIVLMLISPRWRMTGLYSTFLLISIFTGYLLLLSTYSYYIPCSCGGILEQLPLDNHILLNILMAIVALLAIINHKRLNHDYRIINANKKAIIQK